MSPTRGTPEKRDGLLTSAWRWGAAFASTGAALVSILNYARTVRHDERTTGPADGAAAVQWLSVSPVADTAFAIGDTIRLAATAVDERGTTVAGALSGWTSTDSAVAIVDRSGVVVTRGRGTASIVVMAGQRTAQARIVVLPRAAALWLEGDTVLRVPEGERLHAVARVVDRRLHEVAGSLVSWSLSDTLVATVDSTGLVHGRIPGRATLLASVDTLRAAVPISIVPVPASLTVVAGEGQHAPAGRRLGMPVVVQVVSRGGRPVAGAPVGFTASGAGRSDPAADTSDAQGMARTTWTLGRTPGRQYLALEVDGVSGAPLVVAEADPVPGDTRVVPPDSLPRAIAGTAPADSVAIRVTDSTGVALADVPVAWTALDGGTIHAAGTRTDSLGVTRARWTLGPTAGIQRARLQVGDARSLPPFTVRALAVAGPAASLALVKGDEQRGAAGTVLARPILLRVTDRAENPVVGVPVTLRPEAGHVLDSALVTDSLGQVSVAWTLPRTAGLQRLTARAAGVAGTVTVTAQSRPLAAANLAFTTTPAAGRTRAQPFGVAVTDIHGNPVPDRIVIFSARGGTVSPARVMTDARGRAQAKWTAQAGAGAQSVTAVVQTSDVRATAVVRAAAATAPVVARPASRKSGGATRRGT